MPGIKKILFPIDFSQLSIGAARYVEAFAAWFDSKIMLLHVIDADETATRDSIAQQWLLSREEQISVIHTGDCDLKSPSNASVAILVYVLACFTVEFQNLFELHHISFVNNRLSWTLKFRHDTAEVPLRVS